MISIQFLGVVIAATGILFFLKPNSGRKMLIFFRQGRNIYIGGLARITLGFILLTYASDGQLPLVLFVLGFLALTGGLFIFLLGLRMARKLLEWLDVKNDLYLRFLSLLVVIYGVLVAFSA
ncbi:MAG: hypothetical protein WC442_04945 [Candidatus Omnitrophota bacterium]